MGNGSFPIAYYLLPIALYRECSFFVPTHLGTFS